MIHVVGIPADGEPSRQARALIAEAEVLVGGKRQLDAFPGPAERIDLVGQIAALPALLRERLDRRVVVLASGDPLFFGIGGTLSKHFQPPDIAFLPAPTAIAEAFARAGLPWQDAQVLSAHGRALPDVAAALDRSGKVALLTDANSSPAAVGRLLGEREGTAWICERLGSVEERVRSMPITELAAAEADPLNVLLLVGPKRPRPTIPWTRDDDFEKKIPKKGLITKREVRTLSLGALGLRPGDVAWDIGAGSGAVAIEMARLGAARVFAIEKNEDGCGIIRANVAAFAAPQVEVIHARAPAGLESLPDPERVFIGGSAGSMADLVQGVLARLRPGGRLVVNAATIENLAECTAALKAAGAAWECFQVSVARSSPILDLTRFEALNPVWVIAADALEAP